MDMENPTSSSDDGASTQSRLESFLAAEDTPDEDQDQDNQAAAQESDNDLDADEPDNSGESPEYQLSDIAKLLGADESSLDVDDDGNVLVKTKIDGQEGKAKFQDLIKSYQLQGHVDRQVREVAEQRKQVEMQVQAAQQQMQVQQQVMSVYAEAKAIELELSKYANIDWNTYFDQDPVEAVKADRYMRDLQGKHNQKLQEANNASNYITQQQQQQKMQFLEQQRKLLSEALPAWNDESVRRKEDLAIQTDLVSRGFDPKEIDNLSDHRLLLLARDAMLYRQSQAGKDTTTKAVRNAPRIIKPGSSSPAMSTAEKTIKQLHANVKTGKSGSVRDYLLASGKV
jgi:hypothetical protein